MIPTSIDGTDITGATIDGQDVEEITVDGDTVFSAQTFPVAYTDLIAWYPFDAATYGGSNTDDVTAILGGSGDDTAFNLSVLKGSPTHTSSGIATDINGGTNSGAFEYNLSDVHEATGLDINGLSEFTISFWTEANSTNGNRRIVGNDIGAFDSSSIVLREDGGDPEIFHANVLGTFTSSQPNTPEMWTMASDKSSAEIYLNGSNVTTISSSLSSSNKNDLYIGGYYTLSNSEYYDGFVDDVRVYNRQLTGTEINQIYVNTEP